MQIKNTRYNILLLRIMLTNTFIHGKKIKRKIITNNKNYLTI